MGPVLAENEWFCKGRGAAGLKLQEKQPKYLKRALSSRTGFSAGPFGR
jgi:hypothetical protein